jgi:putative phage-type endonuclease
MPRFLELDEAKKSPDWNIVFGGGVNAGDAAPILEESPFQSAYGLWLLKTKKVARPPQTEAMKHGNVTEPLIMEWYKAHKGLDGQGQVWAVYDDAEFIRGLGDFWNAEKRHGAEFKAPTRDDSSDHRKAKEGDVPFHYLLQCWHLMEVYDAATWDFVSWRSPEDAVVIPVERNTDFWLTEMVPRYQEFWRRVQEDSWPKPEGTAMEGSGEWAEAARRVLDGKAMKSEADGWVRRSEAVLRRMAVAKTTIGGGIRATWTTYKPRWEVKISAESEAAMQRILKAVEPLEGRAGVGKISTTSFPPNLVLRISEQAEKENQS